MTTLREAAAMALEALEGGADSWQLVGPAIDALKAALAEPEGGGNLPPPLQEPGDFDHAIGADRFKVVRGVFWWHVLIGDSPTEHGKFRSRVSAEKMAADLLREFRNGAFVQHEAALAEPVVNQQLTTEPVQEPVAWSFEARHIDSAWAAAVTLKHPGPEGKYMRNVMPLYTAPLQRKPLTEEEIKQLLFESAGMTVTFSAVDLSLARAIERAHGIGDRT